MNRTFAALALALAAAAPSIGASDVRVDLFTKSGMSKIVITPGAASVELCEDEARTPCLTVRPSDSARCALESSTAQCRAGNASRSFRHFSARSDSVFRLDVVPRGAGRDETMRGVMARSSEIRATEGSLHAVAAIDLETYVRGVLAGEAATLRSPAALEAMSVVAHTWALASRGRHRADGYDFCSLTHCQFFRPPLAQNGNAAIAQAAERTAGLALTHQGKLIDAYYSAHCGGRTASAASVWRDRAAPYLVSVLDPYCARDGQRSWEQLIPWAAIRRVVKEEMGSGMRGTVRDLLVDQKDDSGRVRTLRVEGDSPQRIDANAFRYALNRRLGWHTLKSNLYTIQHAEGGLMFRGRGLGHGVGLCQAGAGHMGEIGIGFERILAHYFPGTTVERAAADERMRVLSSAHFEFTFPAREEPLVARALEYLDAERARLGARARNLPARISVRTHASTEDFIRATGQPGWVSGASDGRAIDLQPLSILESRGILRSTLHHELLHLVIHRLRARGVPEWYEEGMILYLAGEKITPPASGLADDSKLAASRAKMQRDYAAARARVAELARRRGADALWQVLQHPAAEDLKWFKERR